MNVERARWYPSPPHEVWRELTDPETLAAWFGDRAVVIDLVEPHRCLAWTWEGRGDDPPSSVVVDLAPHEHGTLVTVVERAVVPTPVVPIGFRPPPPPTNRGEPRALARA